MAKRTFHPYAAKIGFQVVMAVAFSGLVALAQENSLRRPVEPANEIAALRVEAERGNADAQSNLGMMYAFGLGVQKDEIEALAWFNNSALTGEESAVKNREILERRLGPQALSLAEQRSGEILQRVREKKSTPRNPPGLVQTAH